LPEQIAMQKSIPAIHETPEELRRLLHAERDAQRQQRVQALYLLPTQQARTRLQVAHRLGVSRNPVGRWLTADAAGGVAQLLTIAKAPGQVPRLAPAMPHALQERFAQPPGVASYQAIGQWLQHDYGGPMAYNTVHTLVRYRLRAKRKVPRKSPIKKR
jgi:hypothetical protein